MAEFGFWLFAICMGLPDGLADILAVGLRAVWLLLQKARAREISIVQTTVTTVTVTRRIVVR
jgi:hypothetical protein